MQEKRRGILYNENIHGCACGHTVSRNLLIVLYFAFVPGYREKPKRTLQKNTNELRRLAKGTLYYP